MAKKQEPITVKTTHNGFISGYAAYTATLSTESLGQYATARVWVHTRTQETEIVELVNNGAYRARKGTAAERAAVEEAALAAERARQAEEAAKAIRAQEEPAPVAVHFCKETRFSVAHYGYTIVTSATDKTEALNKARRVIEREAVENGYRFEWHDDQDHLLEFDKNNNWCCTIYGIKALDSAPKQEHDRAVPDFKPCTVEEAGAAEPAAPQEDPQPAAEEAPLTATRSTFATRRENGVTRETYELKLPSRNPRSTGRRLVAFIDNGHLQPLALDTDDLNDNSSDDYMRPMTEAERAAIQAAYNQNAATTDDRPDFLAGLSCGQVILADEGQNGLGSFVIGLYNENGSRLGTGFATIDGSNGPAWELVCDDYLVDMSDEGWSSNDHGIAAVIARAVAKYTSSGAYEGNFFKVRQYVAAKEAEAFHTDTPWFPRTEAERAASDGMSLQEWDGAVACEQYSAQDSGPSADQLAAADQSPELRAFTHSQWELAAWGYNGDGTPQGSAPYTVSYTFTSRDGQQIKKALEVKASSAEEACEKAREACRKAYPGDAEILNGTVYTYQSGRINYTVTEFEAREEQAK